MKILSKDSESKEKNSLLKFAIEKASFGYSQIRSVNFALQGALLPWIDLLTNQSKKRSDIGFVEHLKAALPKIQNLYLQDSKNIAEGIYPVTVLAPENPIKHFTRLPFLFYDAYRANKSRKNKKTKFFDKAAQDLLGDLPDYYKRNFHFQDSGYLGESSAKLYEHQVEVLFTGSADAMRRLIIPPAKRHFGNSDGQGLHFLEIGCGTGRLTKFLALAFPKAKITAVDLSPFYLNLASQTLSSFRKIDYVQGAAEKLDFKDCTFDGIFSSFLFHELPEEIRVQVLQEGFRLLKSGGMYAIADSLQKDDDHELNWAIDQFPQDFHEPFYKNYTLVPLDSLVSDSGFKNILTYHGFLTKVVSAQKP